MKLKLTLAAVFAVVMQFAFVSNPLTACEEQHTQHQFCDKCDKLFCDKCN